MTEILTPAETLTLGDHYLLAYPRRKYGAAVLDGERRVSGADLRGVAREYGGHYAEQRRQAVGWLDESGMGHIRRHQETGYLEVVEGFAPDHAKHSECAAGVCWDY